MARTFFGTPIRGINVNPDRTLGWDHPVLGLPLERVRALEFAGFDTLRVWLPLDELMEGSRSTRAYSTSAAVEWVKHGIDLGFKVVATFASTWDERLAVMRRGSPDHARFLQVCAALGTAFDRRFSPAEVMFQFVNEPPGPEEAPPPDYLDYYREFAPTVHRAIRTAAPHITICVSSAPIGWAGGLTNIEPVQFDSNTMYAFHMYDPGELTHQHNNRNALGLPPMVFPVTDYPGGMDACLRDMRALVQSDRSLDDSQRAEQTNRLSALISWLFGGGGTAEGIRQQLHLVDVWLESNRVSPKQIICTEFGYIGEHSWDGPTGLGNLQSRANYERVVQEEVKVRGYGGWTVYQALGDFNHFEQTGTRTASSRLIVELTEALGLRCPTPGRVRELAAQRIGPSSAAVGFSETADATSYEYRLDLGVVSRLPGDRIISDPFLHEARTLQVRGTNASAAGQWSEAVEIVPAR
jgi:hypothetical protein